MTKSRSGRHSRRRRLRPCGPGCTVVVARVVLALAAALALVSLLESVPPSSASSPTTNAGRPLAGGGDNHETTTKGRSGDTEKEDERERDRRGDEGAATKPGNGKTSWQFFYRKNEDEDPGVAAAVVASEEGGGSSPAEHGDGNNDGNPPVASPEGAGGARTRPSFRFRSNRRRREREKQNERNEAEDPGGKTSSGSKLKLFLDDDDDDDREESGEANVEANVEANEEDPANENYSETGDETAGSSNGGENRHGDKEEAGDSENNSGGGDDDGEAVENSEKGGTNDDAGQADSSATKDTAENTDPIPQYQNQSMQQQQQQHQHQHLQQRFVSPGTIIYRSAPPGYGSPMQQMTQPIGMPPTRNNPSQGQAMLVAAVVNLFTLTSRVLFVKWIANKLAFELESKHPVQHFMWECLNDKFVRDDAIWNRVVHRVPHSMKVSKRQWGKTVDAMGPGPPGRQEKKKNAGRSKTNKTTGAAKADGETNDPVGSAGARHKLFGAKPKTTPETSKVVVVMDFSTMQVSEPDFLRFADVVTFLVGSNTPRKRLFGPNPEIVLMLQSPGGEVTSFAFAAAQLARLRNAGWDVTVCVDRIAASGGYMIASQATRILASPFAMVGSVGVITQSLNFYEILKQHGIQSLVLKAGDSKNPITQFGKVTDEDVRRTQEDLDETHRSFVDLCRSRRPSLDPAVCNGRILSGETALASGMIDRVLTSDEYVLEKISGGDLVMKLHLVSGNSERYRIATALQILPHLASRFRRFLFAGGDHGPVGRLCASVGGGNDLVGRAMQLVGLASVVRRACFARTGSFSANHNR